MQMVFYLNTNIWDNNPAPTSKIVLSGKRLPWQQGHPAGPLMQSDGAARDGRASKMMKEQEVNPSHFSLTSLSTRWVTPGLS